MPGDTDAAREIKSLWNAHNDLKADVRKIGDAQISQGQLLVSIDAGVKRLAEVVGATPNRCVEHGMRIKSLEETVDDLDGRKQCEGCKNDGKLIVMVERCTDQETRIRALESWRWYMGGAIALATGLAIFIPKMVH